MVLFSCKKKDGINKMRRKKKGVIDENTFNISTVPGDFLEFKICFEI
jgi:hypothetical protein